ncbi:MAG: hypothetical protein EBY21_05470 [Alphaproteobacteria bacterium]|nr:hypothetical protein [Alphaproteobacteria bacterium]
MRAARRLDQKAHMTKSPPNDRLKNWFPQSTQELKALWLQGQAIALAQQQGQHEVYKQEREKDHRPSADEQTFAASVTREVYSSDILRNKLLALARQVKNGEITVERASEELICAINSDPSNALATRPDDSSSAVAEAETALKAGANSLDRPKPQSTPAVQETTNPLPEKAEPTTPYQGDGNEEVLLEGTFRMFEKLKAERAQKEAPVK